MKHLSSNEIQWVTGANNGHDSTNEPNLDKDQLFMDILKHHGLYGTLGLGLLLSPGGWGLTTLGLAGGFALGMSAGYLQWLIWPPQAL